MFVLLKTPSLRRFFSAQVQSELGTGAAYVALVLVASQRLHSAWAIASFALTGASNGLLAGPEVRLLQELVGDRLLGRMFGLRDVLCNAAFVLAFLSAGAVLAALGVRAMFALGGTVLVALASVAWLCFHPARTGDALPAVAEPA